MPPGTQETTTTTQTESTTQTEPVDQIAQSHVEDVLFATKHIHISVRGFVGMAVVVTLCSMALQQIEIKEPMYTLGGLVVGFMFGSRKQKDQGR